MLPSTPAKSSSRWPVFALLAVLAFGVFGLVQVTLDDIALRDAAPVAIDLPVDEKAYYDFVEPRLARLTDEVAAVAEMVDGKSRNVIDLTVRGDRIETLTADILAYGETSGVPERFSDIHEDIRQGSQVVNATFDEARRALRTFDFSTMPKLVPQFHRAADILTLAHHDLVAMVSGGETTIDRPVMAAA